MRAAVVGADVVRGLELSARLRDRCQPHDGIRDSRTIAVESYPVLRNLPAKGLKQKPKVIVHQAVTINRVGPISPVTTARSSGGAGQTKRLGPTGPGRHLYPAAIVSKLEAS